MLIGIRAYRRIELSAESATARICRLCGDRVLSASRVKQSRLAPGTTANLTEPALVPITDGKTFCILPWIHMNLNPDGAVTLCCQSHDKICDDEGHALNAQTHSLTEIWNSRAMREIRRDMAEGRLRPACIACVRNESFDRLSHRTYTNKVWLRERPEGTAIAKEIDQSNDWEASAPRYIDFRLGNMCNLKCTACKPLYSSQIERDPVQSQWVPKDAPYVRLHHRFGGVDDWQDADELSREIIALS